MAQEKQYYVVRTTEEFSENPWANDLSLTIKKGNQITAMGKSNKVVDTTTGEMLDSDIAMVSKKVVDKEEFVKIFEGGIALMFSLTKTAQDLFKAVLTLYIDAKFSPEKIYLSDLELEKVGYTRTRATKNNAINQLLNEGFIARVKGEKHWFWINPNMFYKGNRLTLVNQFAVSGTPEAKQMEKEQAKLENQSKQKTLGFE